MFTLVIYSARNLDCRNRRMRFQHRDYDNGRYLDEPNFRSNFIHQSTYSTVKSSLVQDQGNTSLKYIESQSRLLLIFVRLPNTPRQTKRAKDHRRKQSDKEGDRKILHPIARVTTVRDTFFRGYAWEYVTKIPRPLITRSDGIVLGARVREPYLPK